MNVKESAKKILAGIDFALHASHAWNCSDARNAKLLHDAFTQLLADGYQSDFSAQRFNAQVWEYERRLRQPAVMWGVGDALEVEVGPDQLINFVLPTNTALSTAARTVQRARKKFGNAPFEELRTRGPAELGTMIETHAGTFGANGRITHVVCRKPNDPSIRELCLPTTPRIETRTVIPFWGSGDDIPIWIDALTQPVGTEGFQGIRPSILIRFMPEDKIHGFAIENALVLKDVLVDRETGCGIDHNWGSFGVDPWHDLARRVRPEGPLTPDIYSRWKASGVELSPSAWFTLYKILERGKAAT